MNARTTLSAKGQVVIPKDVRDMLGLTAGQQLEVVPAGRGVLLRPTIAKAGRSFEEITAEIRKITSSYKGRPVPVEEMNRTIAKEWAKRGAKKDA
ncbi:AbrB/MazE/SpoVT family DNA-binding domain-containing protein [Sphingomonas gilva]|uniref:AbrB/MazE/SpoVT family DNA-binding domain-containing protein n=1 Tax=Sphingomonas gilva TaxID=2305907 RepID=A0A396RVB2_9SPHN|nr:AbrB/MazE/SpoVT family DNA-binding domain-containing protein [Sphingomonas gilva]RHW19342.1 AbrB/MazE/SpoVT family DNA-binding domain-containing protein [Sphingomonas gilva]